MRTLGWIACMFLLAAGYRNACAQQLSQADFGISVGSTLFFGDLGGANYIGRPLFFDLEKSLIDPVITFHYHYQKSLRFGVKGQLSYTSVAGDDKLIQPEKEYAPEWFRWYRNLEFHSALWEISVQGEYYLTRYMPGWISRARTGVYVFAGLGMFHFNPKTTYNGTEVELRPLHTEGQGFPGTDVKEYALYQPCIPFGAGIRYNVTPDFAIGFEYGDRFTFTDYIDDVSREYVSQADFDSYFSNDPATAALAYELSNRSDEIDPDGVNSAVTAPGEQRGDPKDKDRYSFVQFTFSYVMGQRHMSKGNQMKCMKWGGEGGSAPVKKKR